MSEYINHTVESRKKATVVVVDARTDFSTVIPNKDLIPFVEVTDETRVRIDVFDDLSNYLIYHQTAVNPDGSVMISTNPDSYDKKELNILTREFDHVIET